MRVGRPAYAQLPVLGDLAVRHSWGALPDARGTLGIIRPQEIVDAAHSVTEGRTIPLNLPIDAFDPPLFGRAQVAHQVFEPARSEAEDLISGFNPQASSQLDGLAHVRAREYGFYGGIATLAEARQKIGIHRVAERGIAARGVLLDMTPFDGTAGASPFDGRMYEVDELEAAAAAQRVDLEEGDVLLVRSGWTDAYLAAPTDTQPSTRSWNGLKADESMAEWLWNHGVVAVGADNPAVEAAPGSREYGSLHRRLLPALGMSMFELLQLEHLAEACAELKRWSFLFVSVPLHLPGAVSSPANAMAIL